MTQYTPPGSVLKVFSAVLIHKELSSPFQNIFRAAACGQKLVCPGLAPGEPGLWLAGAQWAPLLWWPCTPLRALGGAVMSCTSMTVTGLLVAVPQNVGVAPVSTCRTGCPGQIPRGCPSLTHRLGGDSARALQLLPEPRQEAKPGQHLFLTLRSLRPMLGAPACNADCSDAKETPRSCP